MMKSTTLHYFSAAMLLLTSTFSFAQTTIAEYELTDVLAPTTEHPNVTATPLGVGPLNGSLTVSPDGAYASGWPSTAFLNESSYFVISISPDAGYEMNITDIDFGYRSSSVGPTFFELYWSTDGEYTNSTRIDSVSFVQSAIHSSFIGGLDIDIPEGETLYLKWYAYGANNPAGTFRLDVNNTNLIVEGTVTPVNQGPEVSFNGTTATVNEADGTVDLSLSILNPADSATSVDVVLVSGDNGQISGFTSQTVTFPANSATDELITLTLTDDALCELPDDLQFELQNISGDNATIGEPSQFDLTILDDDQISNDAYSNDFESNDLSGWNQDADNDWTTTSIDPISGTYSMQHNLTGIASSSSASVSLQDLDLDYETTWSFQIRNGNWTATENNRFWVYLASTDESLLPTSGTSGYAVGVNMIENNELLTLFRIDNGAIVPVIESTFEWDGGYTVGVEVTRTIDGQWSLMYDTDGGFDNLTSAGSATDNTYLNASYFGPVFEFTSTRAGQLWLDDISISQVACSATYYSQESGTMTDAVWAESPTGSAGNAAINRYSSFIIQNGHEVVWQDNHQVDNLTIDSGAILTYNGTEDEFSLGLAGNWTNNGTYNAGNGAVYFFGSDSPRSISGFNSFYDLEINLTGSSIALNNNIDIRGTLLLSNGVLNVNGNDLTLKSDATNTAAVGPVANGSVNGDVTVERYIQDGYTSWRNVGSSVSGATLEDWNEPFTTTGFPGADFPNWPSPANRFPNIKSYDETDLGDREIGWRAATHITNIIEDGQGFWMYIGGSELPNTLDVTGSLIIGEETLNLNYTPSLGAFHDGWNLVSNLYAATINWDSPEFTRTGLEDGIWIWNPDVQQYGSYISGVSTHEVTNEIAHSQSFWVHANAENPTLTFREDIKTDNNNAEWIKLNEAEQGIVRMKITGNGYYDETVLVLNPDATTGYEGSHDALKFFSVNEEVPSLATVVTDDEEQLDLAINSLKVSEGETISIPLRALAGVAGEYTLSVSEIENVPNSSCIYVEDLETGEIMIIEEASAMTFALDTGLTAPRFIIHISGPISTSKQDNICAEDNSGWLTATGSGDGPWTYTWTNEMDEVVQTTTNSYDADTLTGVVAGSYYVEVNSDGVCGNRGVHLMLHEPLAVSTVVDYTAPACHLEDDGFISVALSGGSGSWEVNLYQADELINQISTDGSLVEFNGLAAGIYTIAAENSCGISETSITLTDENIVFADFELSDTEVSLQDGGNIMASNTSQNAELYYWEMGDGTVYHSTDISHTYTEAGEYEITLYSINSECYDELIKSITVIDNTVGIADLDGSDSISMWYDGQQVIVESLPATEMEIRVTNLLGKTMMTTKKVGDHITIPMAGQGYAAGVYFVSISIGDQIKTEKVVLNK